MKLLFVDKMRLFYLIIFQSEPLSRVMLVELASISSYLASAATHRSV